MEVYIYTFPNGKKYVGQTVSDVYTRAQKGNHYKKSQPVRQAIDKYGWDNISIERIPCKSQEELDSLERDLIKELQTQNKAFGYNLDSGGNFQKERSEETKQKISNSLKGHIHSEETKEKIRTTVAQSCGKKVLCVETNISYDSVSEAARDVGLKKPSPIFNCLNGSQQTAKGFHWQYI